MPLDLEDPVVREAAEFGSAWRELRRARWLSALAGRDLPEVSSLEAGDVDTLDQIGATGMARMHEIADGLRVDASTATRAVDRLERRGLAERRRDPVDGRYVQVWLTDLGTSTREVLLKRRLDFVARVLDQFDPADRAALVRLLPLLADRVNRTVSRTLSQASMA